MLRELNTHEMKMVSGGNGDGEPDPGVTVIGTRTSDPWAITIDGDSLAAMSLREYFDDAWYASVQDAVNNSFSGGVLPEGVEITGVNIPNPDTTSLNPSDPITVPGIEVELSNGVTVWIGGSTDGTVGGGGMSIELQ